MSTKATALADSAVALVGLIHEAAIEQGLELADSLARLREMISQMAGRIDALEDERARFRRINPFPGRTEDEAGPIVALEVAPMPPHEATS